MSFPFTINMQWDVGSAQQIPSAHVLNTTISVDKPIHDNTARARVTVDTSSTQTQLVPTELRVSARC